MATKELLRRRLPRAWSPNAFHVFVGYAGWGAGQLEHEVDLGAWHIMPADSANVFHANPESLWEKMIRRTETQIARAAR